MRRQFQTTKKLVAMKRLDNWTVYIARASDKTRVTFSPHYARSFSPGEKAPEGFQLITITYQTELLGGGYYVNQ